MSASQFTPRQDSTYLYTNQIYELIEIGNENLFKFFVFVKVKIELWMKSFSLGIKCKSNIREQVDRRKLKSERHSRQKRRKFSKTSQFPQAQPLIELKLEEILKRIPWSANYWCEMERAQEKTADYLLSGFPSGCTSPRLHPVFPSALSGFIWQ